MTGFYGALDKTIISPLGETPIQDIKNHYLTLTNPDHAQSFSEDPIRLLRYIHYLNRGHRGELSDAALRDYIKRFLNTDHYCPAQKQACMVKYFSEPTTGLSFLRRMHHYGALSALFPESGLQDPVIFKWVHQYFDTHYKIIQDAQYTCALEARLIYLPFFVTAYYLAKKADASLTLVDYFQAWLHQEQLNNNKKVSCLFYLVNVLQDYHEQFAQYMQNTQQDKRGAITQLKTEARQHRQERLLNQNRKHQSLLFFNAAHQEDSLSQATTPATTPELHH